MAKKTPQERLDKLRGKTGDSVNGKLVSDAIRHAVILERYKRHEVDGIVRFLDSEVVPELIRIAEKRLGNDPSSRSGRQVAQAAVASSELLKSSIGIVGERVTENLELFATSEGKWHTAVLKKDIPVGLDLRTPPPGLLRELINDKPMAGGTVLSGWFDRLGESAAQGVSRQIRVGAAAGESIDQIVKRIVGDADAASAFHGEMSRVKRDASSVVRTAINHASSQAREASYAENSDVIKGVRIVATLDERTTEICREKDGKVYPVNEGPRPPFHWNCRTTTVAVTKSWSEIAATAESKGDRETIEALNDATPGERASMDGQVPGDVTYKSWLRDQPPAFQDDVLGPAKAEEFRRGGVEIDGFKDEGGKRLTLDQMQEALRSEDARPTSKPRPTTKSVPITRAEPASLPGRAARPVRVFNSPIRKTATSQSQRSVPVTKPQGTKGAKRKRVFNSPTIRRKLDG